MFNHCCHFDTIFIYMKMLVWHIGLDTFQSLTRGHKPYHIQTKKKKKNRGKKCFLTQKGGMVTRFSRFSFCAVDSTLWIAMPRSNLLDYEET